MADGDVNLILKGFDSYEVSLGDALRGERATLGKSLLDVERDLKIRAAYISAIEECDINAFPNTGFVAGYVRSYARYLNLDPDPTFEAFCREANFKGTDVTSFQTSPKVKSSKIKGLGNRSGPLPSISEKWEPGSVGIPTSSALSATNILNSFGPIAVLILLSLSLGYGALKIFENIQRIDLVAIEESPVVTNMTLSNFNNFVGTESGPEVGVTADVMALYSNQITKSKLSNPRDGRIADIDTDQVGFYADNTHQNRGDLSPLPSGTLQKLMVPGLSNTATASDQPVDYNKTLQDENRTSGYEKNLSSLKLPGLRYDLPMFHLFSFGPSWIKMEARSSGKIYEAIIDSETPLMIDDDWHYGSLRAGNANNLYLVVNGAAFGPISDRSVIKNVEISENNFISQFKYNSEVTSVFNSKMSR